MKRTPLVLITALALLVPAAVALAGSPPKPSDSTVVPTSIAGVKLGMSETKARAAWGGAKRGECISSETSGRTRCTYGDPEGGPSGYAYVEVEGGKVAVIVVYGGQNAANEYVPSAGGALTKIKTKDGIGIGAKFSKLKSTYPKGALDGKTGDQAFNYTIAGKGGGEFNFGLLGTTKKVYALALIGR